MVTAASSTQQVIVNPGGDVTDGTKVEAISGPGTLPPPGALDQFDAGTAPPGVPNQHT
jgi:hypothetical protein